MDTTTDEELILKVQKGDRAAFEQLYWRYEKRILQVVYGYVRNKEDAVELTQEVFVKVYQNISKYQPGTKFFTWVYRIAANASIDRIRRKKTAREVEFDNDYQKNFSQPEEALSPSLGLNPELATVHSELREHLAAAMDSLSPKHREIMMLREIEGLSYDEIANLLDIQIGTVMSRLYYARLHLQSALKAYVECSDISKSKR
ncbi:MAG: sigma-70 family RNA polymerase sigma factor [Proteobacteria bacterium]|nr:sigma-70 family RNA polymerase sigma factor [Pseudomonadota bacterium]